MDSQRFLRHHLTLQRTALQYPVSRWCGLFTSWCSTVSNRNPYSLGRGQTHRAAPASLCVSHIFCMGSLCFFTSAPQQLWGTAVIAISSMGQCFLHRQSKTLLLKQQHTESLIQPLAEISPSQDSSYREEIHCWILPENWKPICVF